MFYSENENTRICKILPFIRGKGMEKLIEMPLKIDARIKEINEILKGKQNEIKN